MRTDGSESGVPHTSNILFSRAGTDVAALAVPEAGAALHHSVTAVSVKKPLTVCGGFEASSCYAQRREERACDERKTPLASPCMTCHRHGRSLDCSSDLQMSNGIRDYICAIAVARQL
jgi:hypothetical protein